MTVIWVNKSDIVTLRNGRSYVRSIKVSIQVQRVAVPVSSFLGQTTVIQLNSSKTVFDLKQRVSELSGIPASAFVLLIGVQLLRDEQRIHELEIDAVLHEDLSLSKTCYMVHSL